jgi:hypothetical protein
MRANFGRTTIALAGGLILAALTVGHELIAQCQVEPGSEIANDAAASNSSLPATAPRLYPPTVLENTSRSKT